MKINYRKNENWTSIQLTVLVDSDNPISFEQEVKKKLESLLEEQNKLYDGSWRKVDIVDIVVLHSETIVEKQYSGTDVEKRVSHLLVFVVDMSKTFKL